MKLFKVSAEIRTETVRWYCKSVSWKHFYQKEKSILLHGNKSKKHQQGKCFFFNKKSI